MIEKESLLDESDQLTLGVSMKNPAVLSKPGRYKWKTNLYLKFKDAPINNVKLNVRESQETDPCKDISPQNSLALQEYPFKHKKFKLSCNEASRCNSVARNQQEIAKKRDKSELRHSKRNIEKFLNPVQALHTGTNISASVKEIFNNVVSDTNVNVSSKNSKPVQKQLSFTKNKNKTSSKSKRRVHKRNLKNNPLAINPEIIQGNSFSHPSLLGSDLSSELLFRKISKDSNSMEDVTPQLPILDGFRKSDFNEKGSQQCLLNLSLENRVVTTKEVHKLPTMNDIQQGFFEDKNSALESVSGFDHDIIKTASINKLDLCLEENSQLDIEEGISIKECKTLKEPKMSMSIDKSMVFSPRSLSSKTHMAVNSLNERNTNFGIDGAENKSQEGQSFHEIFANTAVKDKVQVQNDTVEYLKYSYNTNANMILNDNSLHHKNNYLEVNNSNTLSVNLIMKPTDSEKTLGNGNMPLIRANQPFNQRSENTDDTTTDLNDILNLLDDESVVIEKRAETNNFNCVRCRKEFMNLLVYCNHFRNCDIGSKDNNVFLDNIEWMCLVCSGIFESYNGLAAHRPCPKLSDTLKHPFLKQDANFPSGLNKGQGIESIASESPPSLIYTGAIKKCVPHSITESNQHIQNQNSPTSIECTQKEHPLNKISTHNYSKCKRAAIGCSIPYEQQCNSHVDESSQKKCKDRNLLSDGQFLELQGDKSNVSSTENLNEPQNGVGSLEMEDIVVDLKSPKMPVKDESNSSLCENATISDLKSMISNLKVELDSSRYKNVSNLSNSYRNESHKEESMLPKEEEREDSTHCKSLPCLSRPGNQFEKCPCYRCASNLKVKHEQIDDAIMDVVSFEKSEKPAVCMCNICMSLYPEICQCTPSYPYINSNLNSYLFVHSAGMRDEKKKIILNDSHHKSIDATYDCCLKKFLHFDRKIIKKNLNKVERNCFISKNQTLAKNIEFSPRIISVFSKSDEIYNGEAVTNNPIHNHPSTAVNQGHVVTTTADHVLPNRAVPDASCSSTNKSVPSYFNKQLCSPPESALQKGVKLPQIELKFTEDLSVSHNFYEKKNPGGKDSSYICAMCFSKLEKKEDIAVHYFKDHGTSDIKKNCYVLTL